MVTPPLHQCVFTDTESQRPPPVSGIPVVSNSSWWKSLAKYLIILPVLPVTYFAGHLLQSWFGNTSGGQQDPSSKKTNSFSVPNTNKHGLVSLEAENPNSHDSLGSATHVSIALDSSSLDSLIDMNSFDDGLSTFSTEAPIAAMSTAQAVQKEEITERKETTELKRTITKFESTHSPHYSANSLTDGLVASYPFSGNANDTSGNGHDGVVIGATLTTDRFGNANSAYYFDGSSRIAVPDSSALDITSSWTISVWVIASQTPTRVRIILGKHMPGIDNDASWNLIVHPEKTFSFNSMPPTGRIGVTSNVQANIVAWTHIALTFDKTNSQYAWYINKNIQTGSIAFQISDTIRLFTIGDEEVNNGGGYLGKIDEVRVYNRPLTDQEVTALYLQPAPSDGTVIHYNFAGNLNGQNGVRDSSGFSNFANAVNIDFSATDRFGHPNSAAGFPNSVANPALNPVITIPYSQQIHDMEVVSFSAWIYVNQWYPYGGPTFPIIDGNNYHWLLEVGGSQEVCCSLTGNSGDYVCSSNYHIQTLNWYHIVLTYSFPGTYNVFANGNIVLSGTTVAALPITNVPIYVGYGPTGATEWANGKIADVRFYNYTITAQQVSALYSPYPTVNSFAIARGGSGFLNTTNLYAIFDKSLNPAQVTVTFSGLAHLSLNPLTTTLANLSIQYTHDCSLYPPSTNVTLCDPFACGASFPLNIIYTPLSPVVITSLFSQASCCTAGIGQSYNFIFNSNSFVGPCAPLTYTATKADGSVLPPWLNFNPTTRTFSGTPNAAGQIGPLALKVTATDSGSASVSSAFTLTIAGTLSATNTATPISYTEDTEYNLADMVITTPSPTITVQLTSSNPVVGALSTATSGAVTSTYNSATGVWQASGAKADVNALLAGLKFNPALNKHDNFSVAVSITDGYGQALTSTINATGIAVNDPPVVNTPIQSQVSCCDTSIGNAYSFTFAANTFTDVDGDTLTYTATKADGSVLPTWLNFNPTTRTFSGTPNVASQIGNLGLKVTATDPSSASAADIFNLNIIGTLATTNTAVPISYIEDTQYNLADMVITTPSQTVTVQLTSSNPVVGALSTATSGTVTSTYNPATAVWQASGAKADVNALLTGLKFNPAPNKHDNFSVAVSITDGYSQALTSTINATGIAVNDQPVVNIPIQSQVSCCDTSIGNAYSFTFAANTFTDVDGDTLTYTATKADGSPLPVWLTFNPTTRTFSGIPNAADQIGNLGLKVIATDPSSTSAADIFNLNIIGTLATTNTAAPISYTEDTEYNLTDIVVTTPSPSVSVQLTLNDPAAGMLNTATIGSVTSTFNPAAGVWQANGAKTDVNALLAGLKYQPALHYRDAFSIAVRITDSFQQNFLSTINAVGISMSYAPVVNKAIGSQIACCVAGVGENYGFTFASDSFTDPHGGALTYTVTQPNGSSLPTWLGFNVATHTFSGMPNNASLLGNLNIKVTATNPEQQSTSSIFTLNIAKTLFASNTAATINYTEDESYNLNLIVVTTPSSTVTVQLTLNNKEMGALATVITGTISPTFNSTTGVWQVSGALSNVNALLAGLKFIPAANKHDDFSIAVSITDGYDQNLTSTINAYGTAVNDPPVVNLPLATQISCCDSGIGNAYSFTFAANTFTDVDGDTLTYTATLVNGSPLPTWLIFNPTTRTFSGTPNAASQIGSLALKVTATDSSEASAFSTFSLQIAKTLSATNTGVTFIYTEDTVQNLPPIGIITPSATASIQITLSDPTAGVLTPAMIGSATSIFNTTTGVLQVNGNTADVNAVLASLPFQPAPDYNNAFGIAVNIVDSYGQIIDSTITAFGRAVDDRPEVTVPVQSLIYTKDDAPLPIASELNLTDIDSALLTSVVVSISDGLVPGDQLSAITLPGVTLAQDLQRGTLTMVGLKSPAIYQQVLRTLTYYNRLYNRQHTKEIMFEVSDQTSSSLPVVITINYKAIKMPPTFVTHISAYNATVGTSMELNVTCEDPNGDSLVATATNAPTWLDLSLLNSIMKLSGTAQMPPGTYAMQLTISNGFFNTSQALQLSVNQQIIPPDNNNPIFYIVGAGGGALLMGGILGLMICKAVKTRRLQHASLYDQSMETTLQHNQACSRLVPSLEIRPGFIEYLERIGSGSSAEVHKVKLLEHGNMNAALKKIKFLPTWSPKDKNDAIAEFHTEIGLLRSLPHPNIIPVYGYISDKNTSTYALVMELATDGSLAVFLRKNGKNLDLKQKLQIITGIAQGLNYLHTKHVVHRDIKSLNILIFSGLVPKIIDFGFAHYFVFGQKELTPEELRVGSTYWVAPEIFKGDKVEPYACDVYAFGIVMWEIMSCIMPYADISPGQIQSHVIRGGRPSIPESTPPNLAEIIKRCWAGEPQKRPSMSEIARVVTRILEEINAHQSAPAPRLDKPTQQPSISNASVLASQPHKVRVKRLSSKTQSNSPQQIPLSSILHSTSGSSAQMPIGTSGQGIPRQLLLGLNFHQPLPNLPNLPPVPSAPPTPVQPPGGRSAFFAQSPPQLEMQIMTQQQNMSSI